MSISQYFRSFTVYKCKRLLVVLTALLWVLFVDGLVRYFEFNHNYPIAAFVLGITLTACVFFTFVTIIFFVFATWTINGPQAQRKGGVSHG